jgi:hypothetical protein
LERLAQAEGAALRVELGPHRTSEWRDVRGNVKELVRVAPMHGVVTASRIVSPARAGAVVDNLRTRVVSLALELENVAPMGAKSVLRRAGAQRHHCRAQYRGDNAGSA